MELQGVFRAHCDNLRAQREEKKVQAVGEACRKLRDQLEKEAEEDRERIIQALRNENQVFTFFSGIVYLSLLNVPLKTVKTLSNIFLYIVAVLMKPCLSKFAVFQEIEKSPFFLDDYSWVVTFDKHLLILG